MEDVLNADYFTQIQIGKNLYDVQYTYDYGQNWKEEDVKFYYPTKVTYRGRVVKNENLLDLIYTHLNKEI